MGYDNILSSKLKSEIKTHEDTSGRVIRAATLQDKENTMNSVLKCFTVLLCVICVSGCGGGGGGGSTPLAPPGPLAPQGPLAPPASGEANLQWNAPVLLINGSAAAGNIAGYNVYRLATGAATCPVDISLYVFVDTVVGSGVDPQAYNDTGLADGTYCYAVTALNFSAQESIAAFLGAPLTVS